MSEVEYEKNQHAGGFWTTFLKKIAISARLMGKELKRLKLRRLDLQRADLRLGEKAYSIGTTDAQSDLVSSLDVVRQRLTKLRQQDAEPASTFGAKAKALASRFAKEIRISGVQLKRRRILRRLGANLRESGTNSSLAEEAQVGSAVANRISSLNAQIRELAPQTYLWARRPLLLVCLLLLLAVIAGAFAVSRQSTAGLAQQSREGRPSLSEAQMNKMLAQQQGFAHQTQQMVAEATRREIEQRQARIAAAEREYKERWESEHAEAQKKQREEAQERERIAVEHTRAEEKQRGEERRIAAEKAKKEQQRREAEAQRDKERQEAAARAEQQKKRDAATYAKLEQLPSASATVATSSESDLSTPRKAAQAFDEALERNDMKLASSLAIGDEKQLAIAKAQHDFVQAMLRLQLSRAKRFGADQTINLFDPNWSKADEHVEADKATVNHGIMSLNLEKRGAIWKIDVRASTAGAAPNILTLVQNLVKGIDDITGKTAKGDYKSDKDVQNALDVKLAPVTGSQRGNVSAERSAPRSEDSLAVERWWRSRLAGGMTERQIVEASDLIAGKFASSEVAEIRERCFKGTGDQRQFDDKMLYSLSQGEYVSAKEFPSVRAQAERLREEINQMFPPRAVFETSITQSKAKALPPIEEPIQQGPRPPGSLVKEHLETFENAMLHLADAYLSQRPYVGKSRLSYYKDVKSLQAGDVLYCRYESGDNSFHERPYFFWYRENPPGLEELLRTLPQDHPIRQIGPPLEEAPPTLELAMKANVATAEDVKKMMAESRARAEKQHGSHLTGTQLLGAAMIGFALFHAIHHDNKSSGEGGDKRFWKICPCCMGDAYVNADSLNAKPFTESPLTGRAECACCDGRGGFWSSQ